MRNYDLSQKIIALSDAVVHLPMYGMVNSLNVSTVAAVLMYDLIDKLDQIASGADLNHVKPERSI